MGHSKSHSNSKRDFMVIQAYLQKQEKYQINNLVYHLKELEEQDQIKPKVSRRQEIIKIREEINKIDNNNSNKKSPIEMIIETKAVFFF